MTQNIKVWQMPSFGNLEMLYAQGIHYVCGQHSHETYSIGIVEDGVRGNVCRGSTYFALPNSVIFINPDEIHTGFSANDLPLTYRMLYPGTTLMQQICLDIGIEGLPYFDTPVVQDQLLAQRICYLHCLLALPGGMLEQESLFLDTLSAAIARHSSFNLEIKPTFKDRPVIKKVKEYLQDNFKINVSMGELVELTNLNASYLIRLFRDAVGQPPHAYLLQIRMEKAKQLLAQGKSPAEVAIAVGMSDQSHLTRKFKQLVGTTPGDYRKMSISFNTGGVD